MENTTRIDMHDYDTVLPDNPAGRDEAAEWVADETGLPLHVTIAYVQAFGDSIMGVWELDEIAADCEYRLRGSFDEQGDFARWMAEQDGDTPPDYIDYHVDWDAVERDMESNGDIVRMTVHLGLLDEKTVIFDAFH